MIEVVCEDLFYPPAVPEHVSFPQRVTKDGYVDRRLKSWRRNRARRVALSAIEGRKWSAEEVPDFLDNAINDYCDDPIIQHGQRRGWMKLLQIV
jgi:hypothetical protein